MAESWWSQRKQAYEGLNTTSVCDNSCCCGGGEGQGVWRLRIGTSTFRMPVNNVDTFDWIVDWGDGSPLERFTGYDTSDAPDHTFRTPGEHVVGISPAVANQVMWLKAYGGNYRESGAVLEILDPLQPTMLLDPDDSTPGMRRNMGFKMFYNCHNLRTPRPTRGNAQLFPASWANLDVGDYCFASMFEGCDAPTFTPSDVTLFKLRRTGDRFGERMFARCQNATGVMNMSGQAAISLGHYFMAEAYREITGSNFTIQSGTLFPTGGSLGIGHYAYTKCFRGCWGDNFSAQHFGWADKVYTDGNMAAFVPRYFASEMFMYCQNEVFDIGTGAIPQPSSTPPGYLADGWCLDMFAYAGGPACTLPCKFAPSTQHAIDASTDAYTRTFYETKLSYGLSGLAVTNGCATPSYGSPRETFAVAAPSAFSDWAQIPAMWK